MRLPFLAPSDQAYRRKGPPTAHGDHSVDLILGVSKRVVRLSYDRGRNLERAQVGVRMDPAGVAPREARRYLRDMLPRLKARCGYLAQQAPGAVSNVAAGDRRLDAAARSYR